MTFRKSYFFSTSILIFNLACETPSEIKTDPRPKTPTFFCQDSDLYIDVVCANQNISTIQMSQCLKDTRLRKEEVFWNLFINSENQCKYYGASKRAEKKITLQDLDFMSSAFEPIGQRCSCKPGRFLVREISMSE